VVIVTKMQILLCLHVFTVLLCYVQVTYLPVKQNGLIDVAQLEAAIRPDTALVSVMAVNNEIGVIQPLKVHYAAYLKVYCLLASCAVAA
jgi:cysteine sulfinate desulfinase/cysteine desulfurase-like protein